MNWESKRKSSTTRIKCSHQHPKQWGRSRKSMIVTILKKLRNYLNRFSLLTTPLRIRPLSQKKSSLIRALLREKERRNRRWKWLRKNQWRMCPQKEKNRRESRNQETKKWRKMKRMKDGRSKVKSRSKKHKLKLQWRSQQGKKVIINKKNLIQEGRKIQSCQKRRRKKLLQ